MKINDRDFTLSTRVSHKTDDEGNETTSTVTTVFEGKDEIQIENFQSFYDEVAMIALADNTEANAGGSPELTLHYTFDDDTSDTVEFYAAGDSKYVVENPTSPECSRIWKRSTHNAYNYIYTFRRNTTWV